MKDKQISVTIGISAYNEEANIGFLLASLLSQVQKSIKIQHIIVVSDGSTDQTVAIVKSYKDRGIECIEGKLRVGKPSRLNQLFSVLKTDVLVIVDADVICTDPYTLEKLVCHFRAEENVGLVSGNPQPFPARTLTERAINNYFYARNSVAEIFDFGKTGYSVHGFLAYSKTFLQNFRLPTDILNDDAYSYFTCITSKFKHVYVKDAIVHDRSAGSAKDYIKQINRYILGGYQLHTYFDQRLVDQAIKLPTEISLQIMLFQLKKDPIAYLYLKLLTLLSVLYRKIFNHSFEVTWKSITTSKTLI
ncbi:MAG: Glycosyl transferase, family 2 [Candidatus Gottesmanbacteria bacterium GW2011_GWB1_43_11]|uniref:Glycosyl transferase, family 2 n=1 Tax=Candidatus Gottesmanbacteria bacterium GW2011_GWB1_43_11 TaxID=1618446 RepID=A0A0G1CQ03_9BACT|nr:MAG: Glycosyl transferase, family 2 [Candidatus Gottesmanbacteria bacterium GW2011_GWA2_42_16]KKS56000.1 MAG: Glycosyl transferase, family 2 [Candidatus Gottesmanbacteria bacterium GW2011_GWA1_42_26]KKS82369.1 MAG: Glycosyl transferase, family 2 [Candidatus Gottesmanbacteria bacterium GW2011_GWC1_43_10]KKS87562.1 MAG: Glycosyl transferase, family 2 [Candidatus Gottesmanbacteria bacterium GW2011_GWB1_43_11]OGG10373.1 MAG: hypothetical protein A2699_01035 [Candidatus Gottesmanbacteria bacteriu